MNVIPDSTVQDWTARADAFFEGCPSNRHMVETGVVAWALAGKLGFLSEAYSDRAVKDAHIQTALQRVFPQAVFHDPKRY